MTAFEINAEVYHNLGLIANDETYMKAVLDLINKFIGEKKSKEETKKIHVKRNQPSSLDKYVGIFSSSREDDEKSREEYMREKYGKHFKNADKGLEVLDPAEFVNKYIVIED